MKYLIYLLIIFMLTNSANAKCNFKSGEYISDLNNPQNIISIEVKVPKSSRFAKNFLRIIASKTMNIPPEYKKRFNANITVNYKFGECSFKAKVRQSGDWKDHVKLLHGGFAIQSLDVKLLHGNILGAVRFKLLIPETRNGVNEILATVILKELGFISPETFEVMTSVNGSTHKMLFQEKATKELLERNNLRESAIFKGDEELLWSYKDHANFALEPLALSKLENKNWFLKGRASQKITLSAFSQLQEAFITYATAMDDNLMVIFEPNNKKSNIFSNYLYVMLAMNGGHALRPHNRMFYYNSLNSIFEPIYYDGNIIFNKIMLPELTINILEKAFNKAPDNTFINKLISLDRSENIKDNFLQRVEHNNPKIEEYFDNALNQLSKNVKWIQKKLTKFSTKEVVQKGQLDLYIATQNKLGISQELISDIKIVNENFITTLVNGKKAKISKNDVAEIISQNKFNGERTVLLKAPSFKVNLKEMYRNIPNFPAKVFTSKGISLTIQPEFKKINFSQSIATDWVLIQDATLEGWSITFDGIMHRTNDLNVMAQRFNEYGLTGCLSIHRVNFKNANFDLKNGNCEDSLNIIESKGTINEIYIENAFADALDIDFSDLTIHTINISSAGNDCLDVSAGKYLLNKINLFQCGDKGLSVGERSELKAANSIVSGAEIGVSSKDLSTVILKSIVANNVNVCVEVKQKKQEFGGAFFSAVNFECNGSIEVDRHSVFALERL